MTVTEKTTEPPAPKSQRLPAPPKPKLPKPPARTAASPETPAAKKSGGGIGAAFLGLLGSED